MYVHAVYYKYIAVILLLLLIFIDVGYSVATLVGVSVALFVLGLTQYFVAMFVLLFFVYKKKGKDLHTCVLD